MNVLFSIRNNYIIYDSFDNAYSQLADILNKPWYDFSENIAGTLSEDGRFKLSPKWQLGSLKVFGMMGDATYLIGRFREENGKIIIEATTRPNYALVASFYFLFLLLLLRIARVNLIEGPLSLFALMVLALCTIHAAIMVTGVVRLRNRFERLMQLERNEDL